ncbi:MAG: dephospho-CoA kinase [Chloroflexi bacterium]|nr:dephospho-CoA kinase [Chloroflexota bacterium]MQC18325.1 dephospho-CoA kinase [Chloroflexota bacterium]
MTVIGLAGGIASGKSTAAEHLRGLGATLIDADRVGHRSYEPGTPGFEKVVNAFGHEIVGKDGIIDRRILGGKVFGNPAKQERLQNIVWPEIRRLISDELRELKRRDNDQIIVIEAAVLIEAGWTDLCDKIWVVTTTQPIALARLMSRNALSEDAALARIHAQAGTRERALAIANVKIDNSGTEDQLQQRLDRAWRTLTNRLADERGVKRPTRLPVRPAAKPAGKKAGKSAAKPAARAASKTASKPAPKAVTRPAAKPAPAKPAAKSAPAKAAAKPVPKAAVKPATKPATTPPSAPAAKKPAAKAVAKSPARVAASAKTPPRASTKAAAKPAVKAAARSAAKPAGARRR